jgi:hypothetical protein
LFFTAAYENQRLFDARNQPLDAMNLLDRAIYKKRGGGEGVRKFDDATAIVYDRNAGWSSLVARWAHNPKVGGSNPPPATKWGCWPEPAGNPFNVWAMRIEVHKRSPFFFLTLARKCTSPIVSVLQTSIVKN